MPSSQRTNFSLFWLAQLVSRFGDAIFHVAIIWLAYEITGSKAQMGMITMAGYLPALLLAALAGAAADRLNRRHLMMTSDVVQALAVACIPLLSGLGILEGWHLAAIAFCMASAECFFAPARDSFLPEVADPDRLLRANSFLHVSGHLAWFAGPVAAGLLMGSIGIIHLFSVDALTFCASFICLSAMRLGRKEPRRNLAGDDSTLAAVLDGLRYAAKDRRLSWLLLLTGVNNLLIMGPALVGTPIFIREELGGSADDFATAMACLFAGMAMGSALLGRFGGKLPKGKLLLLGVVLDGVTFVPFAFCEQQVTFATAMWVHGLTVPLIIACRPAIVQETVEARFQGRIFALINLVVVGGTALSCGATGWLAESVSIRSIYIAIGIGGALCGIVGACQRVLRETP